MPECLREKRFNRRPESAGDGGDHGYLEEEARNNHLERLTTGHCNPRAAVVFNELMLNLERIADHCNNIAEAVLDRELED